MVFLSIVDSGFLECCIGKDFKILKGSVVRRPMKTGCFYHGCGRGPWATFIPILEDFSCDLMSRT